MTRADVFVANVLKCRPPGNRDPLPEEIASCEPHLFRQIELIQPTLVATLGNFATKLLSGKPAGITKVHGYEQEVTLGSRTVLLYPALPSRGGAVHAVDAQGARGGLRAHPGDPGARGRRARDRRRAGSRGGRARPRVGPARPVLRCASSSPARRRARRSGSPPTSPSASCPGDVVTVSGELGSGKTTFVRGASRALGVTAPVTSPTFTIGHRYAGSVAVSHLDLYRFTGVSPAEWADLEPYFDEAVVFVEWPEAGARRPPSRSRRGDARARRGGRATAQRSPPTRRRCYKACTDARARLRHRDGCRDERAARRRPRARRTGGYRAWIARRRPGPARGRGPHAGRHRRARRRHRPGKLHEHADRARRRARARPRARRPGGGHLDAGRPRVAARRVSRHRRAAP